jgi:hypothetical protein
LLLVLIPLAADGAQQPCFAMTRGIVFPAHTKPSSTKSAPESRRTP